MTHSTAPDYNALDATGRKWAASASQQLDDLFASPSHQLSAVTILFGELVLQHFPDEDEQRAMVNQLTSVVALHIVRRLLEQQGEAP